MSSENPITATIVGIAIDPDADDYDMYTLFVNDPALADEGRDDYPVTRERSPILFVSPELYKTALELTDLDIPHIDDIEGPGSDYTIWISDTLFMLNSNESVDEKCRMIITYNRLLDFVAGTEFKFPERHRKSVWEFANYLTFENNFGLFFAENIDISRSDIIDATLWMYGAVTAGARIIRQPRPHTLDLPQKRARRK